MWVTRWLGVLAVNVFLMSAGSRALPGMIVSWDESVSSERFCALSCWVSFEGVRARAMTEAPERRALTRTLLMTPPVAPKKAIVGV